MKTSHILLVTIAVVTLTGMVATDVLLKQQYGKINWSDPYQNFERRPLPSVKHLVLEGTPGAEIIVERATGSAQALLKPDRVEFYQVRQRGDTLFLGFTLDHDGQGDPPRTATDHELGIGLVLQLPDLQSLRITNGRLTLRERTASTLAIQAENSRLRTNHLTVNGPMTLSVSRNSFAVLGTDRYQSLQLAVRDSSGVQLNDTQTDQFTPNVSPKAEVQLRGRALRWLAK